MAAIVIYVTLMGVVAIAVLRRPAYAIGVALCNYGIQQWAQSQDPVFVYNLQLTNYGTVALVVFALLVKLWKGQKTISNYPGIGYATLALFAYALLSVVWSIYPEGSIDVWLGTWRILVVFLLLTPLLITDEADVRAAMMSTLALGSTIVTLLMTTSQWNDRFVLHIIPLFIRGEDQLGGNPLAIATLGAYVVLAGILLNFTGINRFWQAVRWVVVALGLAIAFRSARGQAFAVLFVALLFLPMSRQMRSIRGFLGFSISVLMLAAALFVAYTAFADPRRYGMEQMVRDFQGGRLGTAMTLLSHWASSSAGRYFFGLGSSASYDPMILGIYPHFVTLEVLAELGFVGLAIFASVLFLTVRCIVRCHRRLRNSPVDRGVLAAAAAMFVLEFILGCKQGSLIGNPQLFLFAIMLGRLELATRRSSAPSVVVLPDNDCTAIWSGAEAVADNPF